MTPSTLKPGDRVETPRGSGVVLEVLAGQIIAVNLGQDGREVVIEFPGDQVSLVMGWDPARVEEFLDAQVIAADVEAFLEAPKVPAGGQPRGARTMYCSCDCGRGNRCYRVSTAPEFHRAVTACRCELKGCACA